MKQKQRPLQEVAKEILQKYKEHEEKFIKLTSKSIEEEDLRLGFMKMNVGMYSNEIERASALVEALNATEWLVTGLGQKATERQVRELIEEAEAVRAVPVEYIEKLIYRAQKQIDRIAQENREEYLHGERTQALSHRRVVLAMLLAMWEHDSAQEAE